MIFLPAMAQHQSNSYARNAVVIKFQHNTQQQQIMLHARKYLYSSLRQPRRPWEYSANNIDKTTTELLSLATLFKDACVKQGSPSQTKNSQRCLGMVCFCVDAKPQVPLDGAWDLLPD